MNQTLLHKRIMRRVYTAYAMRMLGGTRARHFAIILLSAYGLMQYVSILDVAHNFSNVTVGDAGRFILAAFSETEMLTLVILTVFSYAVFAFWRGERANTWSSRKTF